MPVNLAQADALARINAGTETFPHYELAGVVGAIEDNLSAYKIAISSAVSSNEGPLTLSQVQAVVDTVNTTILNAAKAITSFNIPTGVTTIDEEAHTITVEVPSGTDPSALVASFTTTGTLVDVGAVAQTSGLTANDFSAPVVYTVTANDSSTQDYIVTVSVLASDFHMISGVLRYYDDVKVVQNTDIVLKDSMGNNIATSTTDINGYYQFTNIPAGSDYIVTPLKEDLDVANGVNILDIIKLRRHVVKLELFDTLRKEIAGDVNRDGKINILDIIKVRRYVVKLDTVLTGGNWIHYIADAVLDNLNYLNTGLTKTYNSLSSDLLSDNYFGIKMGDVNNTWINK